MMQKLEEVCNNFYNMNTNTKYQILTSERI